MHTARNNVPPDFTLLKIAGPEGYIPVVGLADLPEDWRVQFETTRDIGTAWLRKKESALLEVPSAIAPQTENFLFNPAHPTASKFRIEEILVYPFDRRLKE